MSKTHDLKTWPEYYYRVSVGQKAFEVRKNDRDFQINDKVILKEFDPIKNEYTGNEMMFKITYMLNGGSFGIEKGFCVLQLGSPAI